ncbi:DUF2184 domain-containing protein [Profundibacterium mesophilum]|uniref:DUF2184 domain-containing protein n=1 Tax=Profundibacterium mesophilum KAUST100406-0324 TaxID=1037889 RepID=A0A921NRN0_9RHOB|nr:DUF2184 domain-containing protein [Profundibacterium mesophilum]KAF0675079.1 uncharacterized protein PMES_02600 [Profundibacterium mesophilum KAUST100406-0324]
MNMRHTFDAQAALGFVESQRSHIENEVNAEPLPDIQYPFLTPVDTSAHPFTQTVEFYSSELFGRAGWVNGNSDDIPLAGTARAKHKSAVFMAAIGYGFGYEEINVAQMMGANLQTEDAMAARRAYEEFVDDVALRGDTEKGMSGLINHPSVTQASATTGNWATATEDQILKDVNDAILGVATGTNYTEMADTLLLPFTKLSQLATVFRRDMTLMQLLQQSNSYTAMTGRPLNIRGVRGLETAGAGSTNRMIAYRRDMGVLKLHIPMPHRFLPAYQDGPLNWVVPGVFRLGGLDIRRPKAVRYADGI